MRPQGRSACDVSLLLAARRPPENGRTLERLSSPRRSGYGPRPSLLGTQTEDVLAALAVRRSESAVTSAVDRLPTTPTRPRVGRTDAPQRTIVCRTSDLARREAHDRRESAPAKPGAPPAPSALPPAASSSSLGCASGLEHCVAPAVGVGVAERGSAAVVSGFAAAACAVADRELFGRALHHIIPRTYLASPNDVCRPRSSVWMCGWRVGRATGGWLAVGRAHAATPLR